jgi:hypothetical protein
VPLQKYETVEDQDIHWRRERRAANFFWLLTWLVFGGIAGLWWVPKAFGAVHPMSWDFGAMCLVAQWCIVFNHWPRVGTRRFFSNPQLFILELPLLVCVTVSFAVGFAVAA